MKDLKFRAKANIDNEWKYASNIHKVILDNTNEELWVIHPKGEKIEHLGDGYIKYRPLVVDKETISQYTGLKDKNGKEIYVGDIVEYSEYGKNIFEIRSEIGSYMLSTNNVNLYKVFDDCWNDNVYPLSQLFFNQEVIEDLTLYDIEVIGNIHDNKDLLK